jgi:hypothetical protein
VENEHDPAEEVVMPPLSECEFTKPSKSTVLISEVEKALISETEKSYRESDSEGLSRPKENVNKEATGHDE